MFGVIDRFEENLAIVELDNGKLININKNRLPVDVKEGYVIRISENITIDYEKTKVREKEILELTKDLWK